MTRISVHNVKAITGEKVHLLSDSWVKHISILTEDGNDVELALFSDDTDSLNIRQG